MRPVMLWICAAALAAPGWGRAESWPTFRGGPDLAGRREGSVADNPVVAWTNDAKTEILSTAAIVDGRVYIGTSDAGLLCLDLAPAGKVGRVLWQAKTGARIQSSPGARDGKVYFGDDDGTFRALDIHDGKEAWKFETRSVTDGGGEIISSATFHGDLVVFGSYDACLYALGAADGKLRWKYATQGPIHCTPAVADGRTFVAGCDEHLRAIDLATGKEVSALEMGGYSAASPAISGNRLVVGTFANKVICVDWKESKVLWGYEHPERQFPFYSSAAIGKAGGKDVVVLGGRDKLIHALALDDGKELWSFTAKSKVDASPVIVGSRVFTASLDGNLYLLDLETGKEVWRFAGGGGFAASPAVADGRLVISNDEGVIYCLSIAPAK